MGFYLKYFGGYLCSCLAQRCPPLELPDHMTSNSTDVELGIVVSLSCNTGFELSNGDSEDSSNGSSEVTAQCDEDLTWTLITQTCQCKITETSSVLNATCNWVVQSNVIMRRRKKQLNESKVKQIPFNCHSTAHINFTKIRVRE